VDLGRIKGIGFDATCSLVVLDDNDEPVSVDPSHYDKSVAGAGSSHLDGQNGDTKEQNVIMWMDHRAVDQANRVNSTKHDGTRSTTTSFRLLESGRRRFSIVSLVVNILIC